MSHKYPTRFKMRALKRQRLLNQPNQENTAKHKAATKIQRWYRSYFDKYMNHQDLITLEPLQGRLFRFKDTRGCIYRFNPVDLSRMWASTGKFVNPYTNESVDMEIQKRLGAFLDKYCPDAPDELKNVHMKKQQIREAVQREHEAHEMELAMESLDEGQPVNRLDNLIRQVVRNHHTRNCITLINAFLHDEPFLLSRFEEEFQKLRSIDAAYAERQRDVWLADIRSLRPDMPIDNPILVSLIQIMVGDSLAF